MLEKEKHNPNKITTEQVVVGEYGSYVSEVQDFKKPEDYEDAFKKYYPTVKDNPDSSK